MHSFVAQSESKVYDISSCFQNFSSRLSIVEPQLFLVMTNNKDSKFWFTEE